MATLNQINIVNGSKLHSGSYTVWVAGFIGGPSPTFSILQGDGSFAAPTAATEAPFYNINGGLTISVPNVTNYGNNRLVVAVTPASTQQIAYPMAGYTAYPFQPPGIPGACPPGPYDIFEFGPNAEYDVSAIDFFGINLSFTVTGDPLTYGVRPSVTRKEVAIAFKAFTSLDPCGNAFGNLVYSSPGGASYPPLIDGQFSAIVSPKDWLAIHPGSALANYWGDTVNAFFQSGNQLAFYLNATSRPGHFAGSSDGGRFTLTGPEGLLVHIPKSDFLGNQCFFQAVRPRNPGETVNHYRAFNQIEAALFQAFSRGVALDGVVKKGDSISPTHSSNAWTKVPNWFTNHANAYNGKPSVYDVYAKFLHFGRVGGQTIFGQNSDQTTAMAYGFGLDENPNVGSTALGIPPNAWPRSKTVPSETPYDVGNQTVTLTIGPWS